MQKLILLILLPLLLASCKSAPSPAVREKILLNSDWYFFKYDSTQQADALIYDVRPPLSDTRDDKPADAQPTEALQVEADVPVLKPWILPSGNAFIKNPAQHHQRPEGQPGSDFPFVQGDFDDSAWEHVDLPHDWAIAGPFMEGWEAEVGGGPTVTIPSSSTSVPMSTLAAKTNWPSASTIRRTARAGIREGDFTAMFGSTKPKRCT